MHLVHDYVHPTPHRGRCRVRIYLPDGWEGVSGDAPVVICSEVPGNPGQSVTNAAERIAAEVIAYHGLPVPVWIEHYPPGTTDRETETFDLVHFGHHEVREVVRSVEEGPVLEIGSSAWKPLDRDSVEVLVGAVV